MPLKLKTVEVEIDGEKTVVAVTQDGKPVYQDDAGKDVAFDADHAMSRISALNREAQTHREAKESAEENLAKFQGIDDPAAAIDALAKVASLSAGELKTASQVEELKGSIERAMKANYDAQVTALQGEIKKLSDGNTGLNAALDNEVIGGAFARSKYIAEKLLLPADIAEASFRKYFTREDGGKLKAKDANGAPIVSRDPNRLGQDATFDEAIEQLVEAHPNKASILKGSGHSGSDATQGGGGGGGGKQIARAQWDRLDGATQAQRVREGYTVVDAA